MALVNHAKKEINAKIVVCGPAASGKATIMKAICAKLPNEIRGPLRSMGLQRDRMLFFDFTHPEGTDPDCYSVRFHVYTLTGPVSQEHAWKMVLKGVDGIIFVADSDPSRQDENRHQLYEIQSALSSYGKGLEDVSLVALCSKQDIATSLDADRIRQGLSAVLLPEIPLISTTGAGAMEGLSLLLDGILLNLEGLGLALQPSARMLSKESPERTQSEVRSPSDKDDFNGDISVSAATMESASKFTFEGSAEVGPDGILRIPLRTSCCGKESTMILKISLQ